MVKIKLGDLCVPSAGQIKEDAEELIDYFDVSSVDNETKKVTGFQTMSFGESPSRARKAVKKGSILVSTVRPNLNAVALLEEDTPNISVASTGFCILDCKENVDNRFVFSFCKSKPFIDAMVSQATGASYPAVSDKIVRAALVPKYTYEEQCNISETLDKVSNVIDSRKAELSALDDLIKARFVELFSGTYKEVVAEDVCTQIIDCPHSTPKYDEENLIYPAIRTSEIQDGTISWESMKYVGAVEYEKRIKRLKPEKGDIVYAREGTYGDCVILPERHKFCLGQRTMLFRPDYRICTSAYLHAALRSDAVKRQADESNAGSTVPHVNLADAKRFHFPLPPIELQRRFADFVTQVDKSKAAVQKALDETQLLFDSLMQEYFG